MSGELLIQNCRLSDDATAGFLNILIKNKQIASIAEQAPLIAVNNVIDAGGRYIVPGFIDVHIQGAGGADVLDATEKAIKTISITLAQFGVTGFLATTVIKPDTGNRHLNTLTNLWHQDLGGAKLLGIHLEGPFINPAKRGGIAKNAILPPSQGVLGEILKITGNALKMMTLAPELPGNLDIIRYLKKYHIVASFGHSNADYTETLAGFDAGISHITHIFNAMPSLHHRTPGPIAAIFESETVTAQIISDGIHLHPAIVNLIYRNLGSERCICITDGIQAIGLPDGHYFYNGREYESRDGSARYDDGTLIGTALDVHEISRRFQRFTACTKNIALQTITCNPARVLNISEKTGAVKPGYDADLVLLDFDDSVYMTIVDGKIVYQKKNNPA